MRSHCSIPLQDLAASASQPSNAAFEQSHSVKSNHTRAQSSKSDGHTCRTSEIFPPLPAVEYLSKQVASRISSLADFLAKTSPTRDSAPDSMANEADSGHTAFDCFAIYDRDTGFSKTLQRSLLPAEDETSTEFCLTWPRFGMLVSGKLYRLQPLALHTVETESGSRASMNWPTARAEDGESCGNHRGAMDSLTGAVKSWPTPTNSMMTPEDLAQAMYSGNDQLRPKYSAAWPTASATDHKGSNKPGQRRGKLSEAVETGQQSMDFGQPDLASHKTTGSRQEQLWLTPDAPNGGRRAKGGPMSKTGKTLDGKKRQVGLQNQVAWATPQAHDSQGCKSQEQVAAMRQRTGAGVSNLNEQVQNWPTAHANCNTGAGRDGTGAPNLQTVAKGKLNADWVETLMGLPIRHTQIQGTVARGSKRSATASSRKSRKSSSEQSSK